jgi:hypothetical protein
MRDTEFDLKEGDKISFQYVSRDRDYSYFPAITNYEVEDVAGTVIHIRNLDEDKLSFSTVRKNPEIERSKYIVTVKSHAKGIGKYYNGRMINLVKHDVSSVEALVTDELGQLVEDVRAILSISEKGLDIKYKKVKS